MRIVGRYFAIGATLGSVSGLVALVLIWTWLTIHMGVLGLLLGWIPAGIAGAALWLAMVVLWGPVLIVGAMISLGLLLLRAHTWRDGSAPESPTDRPSDEVHGSRHPDTTDEPGPSFDQTPAAPPPALSASGPAEGPAPSSSPTAPAPPAPRAAPDDLGGDAAAAGDTSRRPPR